MDLTGIVSGNRQISSLIITLKKGMTSWGGTKTDTNVQLVRNNSIGNNLKDTIIYPTGLEYEQLDLMVNSTYGGSAGTWGFTELRCNDNIQFQFKAGGGYEGFIMLYALVATITII